MTAAWEAYSAGETDSRLGTKRPFRDPLPGTRAAVIRTTSVNFETWLRQFVTKYKEPRFELVKITQWESPEPVRIDQLEGHGWNVLFAKATNGSRFARDEEGNLVHAETFKWSFGVLVWVVEETNADLKLTIPPNPVFAHRFTEALFEGAKTLWQESTDINKSDLNPATQPEVPDVVPNTVGNAIDTLEEMAVGNRYGTEREMSIEDVCLVVQKALAYKEQGGTIPEFYRRWSFSTGTFALETLRGWLKNPKFNPEHP
jgi:hypothetical protein